MVRRPVLIAVSMLLALGGCGVIGTADRSDAESGPPSVVEETPTTVRITRPPGPTPTPYPAFVDYTDAEQAPDGATVRTPDDVDSLTGAPEDFKTLLSKVVTSADVTNCRVEVDVQRIDTQGWAIGTVRTCDEEHVAVWARGDDGWDEVVSAHVGLDCDQVEGLGVPSRIIEGECLEPGSSDAELESWLALPDADLVDGRYANARFGFSCQVPEGFEEAKETDGASAVTVVGEPDIAMSCAGANNVDDHGLRQEIGELFRSEGARLEAQGFVVTYQDQIAETYVVSGRDSGGNIEYVWAAVGPGSINTVRWSYHEAYRDQLAPLVESSVRTFNIGDLAVPH